MVMTVAAFDDLHVRMPRAGSYFAQRVQSIRATAPVGVLWRVAVGTFVARDDGHCGRCGCSVVGISRRRCRDGGEERRGRKGRLDGWKRSRRLGDLGLLKVGM